jgi:hypothetical protein
MIRIRLYKERDQYVESANNNKKEEKNKKRKEKKEKEKAPVQ